jgi:hypothetical protein
VGEAGIQYTVGLSQRASDLQAKMQAFLGLQQADAGYLVWSYRDPSGTSYGDGYNFLTGDPLVTVMPAVAATLSKPA